MPNWSDPSNEVECTGMYRLPNGNLSVVHQHNDGTWWFYEETWCCEYGPFETELAAHESVDNYVKTCLY